MTTADPINDAKVRPVIFDIEIKGKKPKIYVDWHEVDWIQTWPVALKAKTSPIDLFLKHVERYEQWVDNGEDRKPPPHRLLLPSTDGYQMTVHAHREVTESSSKKKRVRYKFTYMGVTK